MLGSARSSRRLKTPADASQMARNIEVKAAVEDLTLVRQRAAALASASSETIAQKGTFFAVDRGRLKVREFADGSGELIAYSRVDCAGPKESSYSRIRCGNAALLVETLAAALCVRAVITKQRDLYRVGRTRLHLDVVDDLGTFVEIEVVLEDDEPAAKGEREARALLDALGIPVSALVPVAYVDLLEQRRPVRPA